LLKAPIFKVEKKCPVAAARNPEEQGLPGRYVIEGAAGNAAGGCFSFAG
jgi:hypothetical protein